MKVAPPCFIPFENLEPSIPLPTSFTFPFFYVPHPLALNACLAMQKNFPDGGLWDRSNGNQYSNEGLEVGKMFGALVVRTSNGNLGYLAAYSGKLDDERFNLPFVPPIYNLWDEDGFYKKGELELNQLNATIAALENSPVQDELNRILLELKSERQHELDAFKATIKVEKQKRKEERAALLEQDLSELDYAIALKKINQSSINEQYYLKSIQQNWREKIDVIEQKLVSYRNEIEGLKLRRKEMSNKLQQQLFEQYKLLNADGEWKNVLEIFQPTIHEIPPSGAGDCAAPKLLQYAYLNNLEPLALAEFWWGLSPQSEVRKHKQFYPACRGKCEPILGHMLKGLKVDPNPLLTHEGKMLPVEVIYEDDDIIVVNKPAELLSVPGISVEDSVYSRILERNPEISGPVIVHRLDMSTSGVLLLAKHKTSHAHVQRQFFKRSVHKRYVAILDGEVKVDEGTINLPLRVDLEDRPRQLVCFEHGKPALTRFQVIEKDKSFTRIHFFPESGRTHQLRVHAAHHLGLNAPIKGDDLYGVKNNRLHLHAAELTIKHPKDGRLITFLAPEPF